MKSQTVDSTERKVPAWLWGAATFGVAWNLFGMYQYIGTFTAAGKAAMTAGMTPAQAGLYLSLPAWISVVFALGVAGGLVGSIALLMRWKLAQPVFMASLLGYLLLFAGDAYYGVFAAIPGQLLILAFVVLIAAALLATSRIAGRSGLLR